MKRALAFLLLLSSAVAHAFTPGPTPSTGALDNTFGGGGAQYTNFSSIPRGAMAGVAGIALQADGRIVAVGTGSASPGSTVPMVARFTADGALDLTFNSIGSVLVAPMVEGFAVALQADGKIVVAGRTSTSMAVARLNANGTLDTTFASQGVATISVGSSSAAYALAIQADGKIVAAGSGNPASNQDFAVVRCNTDGTLDATFSGDGIATAAVGVGDDFAHAVAIQADGRIVLGGSTSNATTDFALARFNTDGTLDGTFNVTGLATLDFAGGTDAIRALRIAADGKIVAAGFATGVNAYDFAFARYNTNGTLDGTFNGTGKAAYPVIPDGSNDGANAMALLPDGRIVAAGYYTSGTTFLAVMQLTTTGALDTSFGGGSGKVTGAEGAPASLGAVVVQTDGKVIAGGSANTAKDYMLMRVDAAGNADAAFGTSGFTSIAAVRQNDEAYALALQVDGKIVAAGYTLSGFPQNPLALARYTTAGVLDTGFGSSGKVTDGVAAGLFLTTSAYASGVAVQPDGRIVVAGTLYDPPFNTGDAGTRNLFVNRYTAAGGANGSVMTSLDGHTLTHAVRLQADGKIIAAGGSFVPYTLTTPSGVRRFAMARFNTDLTLDATFNGTGKVVTQLGSGDSEANAVAVQADGRIVAVGYSRTGQGPRDFAIARYSATGLLESAFTADVGVNTDDNALAVEIQPDGKILAGGSSGANIALLRYSSAGVLDSTFGNGGKFLFPGTTIAALALQADGKILALTRDFQVWRLTATGIPDTSFGVGGRVALAMGPNSAASAMALQPDGRIVVAGTADSGGGPDFVVARIDPAAALTLMPAAASYDFGGQSMNTTHPSASITVTNPGPLPVTVLAATASASFGVAANGCTLIPGSGTPCQIGATFTPASQGLVQGTLLVEYLPRPGAIAITLNGTGERSLVTHYYRSILRRDPDPGGKAFWDGEAARVSGIGANVNETWYALSQTFYGSPEYLAFDSDNAGYATDLYNTFFNRAPDSGGLAYWKGQLDSGMPREVLLAQFMFSPEFTAFTQAIFGNAAVRAEVNAVTDFYRGILGRLPDDGGFASWIGRFRNAQCQGQAAIVSEVEAISSAFTLSGEYTARGRNNAQYVGDLYNAFLRRGGDLAGVQSWIGQIDSGAQTREQVRVQFKNSPEFQQRVNAIIQQGCL